MDMTTTTIPKSDQINAEDLMTSGPVTVTVESVSRGSAEQPVDIHLVEFPGRAYRPSKTMRRVLVKAWGAESDAYAGRRMTLYYDPDVRFGGTKVGGIKISHASHITKRIELALTETRGKRAVHVLAPQPDARPATAPTEPTAEAVAASTDVDALREMYRSSGPERQEQIKARVAELNAWSQTAEQVDERDAGVTA